MNKLLGSSPKKVLRWGMAALLGLGLAVLIWQITLPRAVPPAQASLIGVQPTAGPTPDPCSQFTCIQSPKPLTFPQEQAPHPDFQTEWWYYTGSLQDDNGRAFGYQLTFFRRAIIPALERATRPSDWAANQIYMAHFTLTDSAANQFHAFERFERGAAGLAGALVNEQGFSVWLEDWSVQQNGPTTYQLRASAGGIRLDLTLTDEKGFVLQGDQGYSQKGPQPGNASIYYSQPRMATVGTLTLAETSYALHGLTWMDREISTSALSAGQIGWDWFALHLSDGSDLMVYVLRRADGTADALSNGLWIGPDGSTRRLSRADFQITPQSTWRSPHSGGTYPASWNMRIPTLDLDLQIQPSIPDQELNVSFVYWEGMVNVRGSQNGQAINGSGYIELTGYAQSMAGTL